MWHDHPFSQRKKTEKRAVGADIGAGGVWVGQKMKQGGVFNIGRGDLNEIGGLRNLCHVCMPIYYVLYNLFLLLSKKYLFIFFLSISV